jgi:peptidoglycan/LPS O-acetylase OafA/YrhL
MKKYAYIDSLRGLAILGVIFVHTAQSITGLSPQLANICNYGKHGVQLFFFLSAYTLCLSMQERKNEGAAKTKYFIRRFFRIAPLYYFGIILYGIIYILKSEEVLQSFQVNTEYSTYKVIRHLTFTQSLSSDVIFGVVPGGWSIGTEMIFYSLFPFLFNLIIKIRSAYLLMSLPVLASFSAFVFFRSLPHLFPPLQNHDFNFYYCTLPNQISVFLLGICFFVMMNRAEFKPIKGWLAIVLFMIITSFLLIVKFLGYNDISIFPFLTACSFMFLFIAFKTYNVINFKILQLIGRVSYSIYLFHFIFAWGVSTYINKFLIYYMNSTNVLIVSILVTILGSLLMAIITKHLIEDRGIALGSKLIKQKLNNA